MNRQWHIYTLSDPRDGAVRYVGITHRDPRRRLSGHLWEAVNEKRLPKSEWLVELLAADLRPICETIQSGEGDGWEQEIRWVKHFRDAGCDLTNANEGGGGPRVGGKWTPEQREKIVTALKGKTRTPAQCAAITARQLGNRPSSKTRERQSAARIGRKFKPLTEEHKAKIRASNIGKPHKKPSAEAIAKVSAALKNKPWSEARRLAEAARGRPGHSEATKAKMRATWALKRAAA